MIPNSPLSGFMKKKRQILQIIAAAGNIAKTLELFGSKKLSCKPFIEKMVGIW
jgi:hypothetical protein